MRRMIFALAALIFALPVFAQNKLNDSADNIIGKYYAVQSGEESNVLVTKLSDGTYQIQVCWMKNPNDKDGNPKKDIKNPDKALRDTPADKVVLVKGLKYLADKKCWGDAKIYDPTRGIKANVTVKFMDDGRLSLRGSVMGIGETVYWKKIQ